MSVSIVSRRLAALICAASVALAACGPGTASPSASTLASARPSADARTDKLAQVQERGTLVLWTDPDYAPQSIKIDGAVRLASSKCASNELTAQEMSGYDAETGKLVAAALGVEPCFSVTPFDAMIAGSWGDRYDVAWGSGAITVDRMTRLYVTQPYYSTPASFFVRTAATFTKPSDLSGKQIGVCSGCTHHDYLLRTLKLPGQEIAYAVDNPKIVTFNTEGPGLEATAQGKEDAFMCSEPVGLAAIAKGLDLRELDAAAYYTYKTGYIDRDLTLAPGPFVAAVDAAIRDLHSSGKLKELSLQFFKHDYASQAGTFDMSVLAQKVP